MKRRHMPLSVKIDAALYALGLDPKDVQWDHSPALGMRPINPKTGDTIPPQNDPKFIVPRSKESHKQKTFGDSRPLSGDVSVIAKLKDVERKEAEFRERLLAKGKRKKSARAKSAFQSRPFPTKKRNMRTGKKP